jgi:transposase
MRTGRPTPSVVLTPDERETLEQWARRPKTAQALAQRERIVLACATDKTNGDIALGAGVTRQTVGRWRTRFARKRLDVLLDEPRSGAPRKIRDAAVERMVRLTLETTPRDATHWSTRAMATRSGLSQSVIGRIWRVFALQPHREKTFVWAKTADEILASVARFCHRISNSTLDTSTATREDRTLDPYDALTRATAAPTSPVAGQSAGAQPNHTGRTSCASCTSAIRSTSSDSPLLALSWRAFGPSASLGRRAPAAGAEPIRGSRELGISVALRIDVPSFRVYK